jgi:ubiquinone biosynthesis protein COQ4
MPVRVDYEIVVKAFEFANLGLPMAGLAAVGAPFKLSAARCDRLKQYIPWALRCGGSARSLITVYWERRWNQGVEELKRELGIWDPPPAVWGKPLKETNAATKSGGT